MKIQKAKIPTRSRMSFIHRLPHYSPRLVFSLGVIQIVCGIAIVFLSLVLYRFDREKALSWLSFVSFFGNYLNEIVRIAWVGGWILASGLVTLLISCRPYSNCQVYMFCFISLITVTITGTFAILISNIVIQQSFISSMLTKDPYQNLSQDNSGELDIQISSSSSLYSSDDSDQYNATSRSNPILILNVFMLCFCAVAFVISIVSFSIVSHHMCACTILGTKFPADYQVYDTSTWSRKERIVQWVMQQSQLNDIPDPDANRLSIVLDDAHDYQQSRHKSVTIQSNTTNSTK